MIYQILNMYYVPDTIQDLRDTEVSNGSSDGALPAGAHSSVKVYFSCLLWSKRPESRGGSASLDPKKKTRHPHCSFQNWGVWTEACVLDPISK